MGLSGWNSDNILKLTIDSSNIDEDLTDFPVLITLSSGTGQAGFDATDVFDELTTVSGSYDDRKKIAVTTTISGVETKLFTEIERWDDTTASGNEQAWLWVKVPTIVSGTDTELYFYYDKNQDDQDERTLSEANDTFTGNNGDLPNQGRWSNFAGNSDIQGNKLEASRTVSDQEGVKSRFLVSGDFDTQVDYELDSTPSIAAWMFIIKAYIDVDNFISIGRWGNLTDQKYLTDERIGGVQTVYLSSTTSDTSGKLRITRSGSTFHTYWWTGSAWSEVGSGSAVGSGEVRVDLRAVSWNNNPTFTGQFDNFTVNSADSITGFVDDTAGIPAQEVWDDNFIGVWHLTQDPSGGSGAIKDSTDNFNCTAGGSMDSDNLIDGKIGKSLDFSSDYLTPGSEVNSLDFTIEAIVNPDSFLTADDGKNTIFNSGRNHGILQLRGDVGKVGEVAVLITVSTTPTYYYSSNTVSTGSWAYLAGKYSESLQNLKLYINTSLEIDQSVNGANAGAGGNAGIGCQVYAGPYRYMDGKIDEVRVSQIARSDAWIKATYYSNWDDLISFVEVSSSSSSESSSSSSESSSSSSESSSSSSESSSSSSSSESSSSSSSESSSSSFSSESSSSSSSSESSSSSSSSESSSSSSSSESSSSSDSSSSSSSSSESSSSSSSSESSSSSSDSSSSSSEHSPPEDLPAWLNAISFENLPAAIKAFLSTNSDIQASLNVIQVYNLPANIHGLATEDLQAILIGGYGPNDLQAYINASGGYKNLLVYIRGMIETEVPYDLQGILESWHQSNLGAFISLIYPVDLGAYIFAIGKIADLPASIIPRVIYLKQAIRVALLEHLDLGAMVNSSCFASASANLSAYFETIYDKKDLRAAIFGYEGSIYSNAADLASFINIGVVGVEDKLLISFVPQPLKYTILRIRFATKTHRVFDTLRILFSSYSGADLPATVTGILESANLSAYIKTVFDWNYSELPSYVNPKIHEIVIDFSAKWRENWRRFVELMFDNSGDSPYHYFYISGADKVYRVNRDRHWTIRAKSYRRTDGIIERRDVRYKYIFKMSDYANVDEAVRDLIDRVSTYRRADLGAYINAGVFCPHSNLSASIYPDVKYSWVKHLNASVVGRLRFYKGTENLDLSATITGEPLP